ncbi:hypothetical protein RclHR1_01940021 [Rhizophagus clarus]|uniref:Uncharacterized protein n=1 Tax=Rhizophagus clarus TaxID=94130 RepID=A0A2Z6R2S8_9GLOM|nr:hypothetical protein RclHR1_01940021 [Rhizophagus clarus]
MKASVTSAYTVEVLKISDRIAKLLVNYGETGENSKETDHVRGKVTRPSEAPDDHLNKRQRRDELQMPEYPTEALFK